MRIANIAPVGHLKTLIKPEERFHLVIADLIVGNETYRNFYKDRVKRGDYVIIDSLAFERPEGSDPETVLDAYAQLWCLGATLEIVLPDRMDDPFESVRLTRQSLEMMRTEVRGPGRETQFMVVPHGRTWTEYLDHAYELGHLTGVNVIGIQEEVEELFGVNRLNAVRMLSKHIGGREFHFNGVTENLDDVRDPWLQNIVRSADTAKFVVWGLSGRTVFPQTKPVPVYPGRKAFGGSIGYFAHLNDNPKALEAAALNISAWREYGEQCAASSGS